MNIEGKKIAILEKIKNSDFVFSGLETYIIKRDRTLQKSLIEFIKAKGTLMSLDEYKLILEGNAIADDGLLIEDPVLIRQLALKSIEIGEFYTEILELDKNPAELLEILDEKLKDLDYAPTRIDGQNRNLLDVIIRNRRLDWVIEYIVGTYGGDKIAALAYVGEHLDELSLADFVKMAKEESNFPFDVLKFIQDKLQTLETITNPLEFERLFKRVPEKQHEALFDLLKAKGYIHVPYAIITEKDIDGYEDIISENVRNGLVFDIEEVDSDKQIRVAEVIGSHAIFWDYLNAGKIKLLHNNKRAMTPENIQQIVQMISETPELFQERVSYDRISLPIAIELMRVKETGANFSSEFDYQDPDSKDFAPLVDVMIARMQRGDQLTLPNFIFKSRKIMDYIFTNKKFEYLNTYTLSKSQIDQMVPYLVKDGELKCKIFQRLGSKILNNPNLFHFYLADDIYVEEMLDYLRHDENYGTRYTSEIYLAVRSYLAKKHNFNIQYMDELVANYGPLLIHYIDSESIQTILRLKAEDFQRILAIFPKIGFEVQDAGAIYDSLKQHEFSKKNSDILNIFNRINVGLENDSEEIFNDFQSLVNMFNEKLYKKLAEKSPELAVLAEKNHREFFLLIKEKIQTGSFEEQTFYRDLLHIVTNHYIAENREKWRHENPFDDFQRENLSFHFDQKDMDKLTMVFFLGCMCDLNLRPNYNDFIIKNGIDIEVIEAVYNCLMGHPLPEGMEPQEVYKLVGKVQKQIRQYIDADQKSLETWQRLARIANGVLRQTPNRLVGLRESNIINEVSAKFPPRRQYYIDANYSAIYEILSNLRIEIMQDHFFDNPEVVAALIEIMHKTKLHICPNDLKDLKDNEDEPILRDGFDGISAFITYFYAIYQEEMEKNAALGLNSSKFNMSISSILKKADAYSGVSSIYTQFLGKQDFKLIKSTPGPNSGYRKSDAVRLEEAIGWIQKMYERQEVSVPTFIEDFATATGKNLQVTVGNFRNPCNLTHGERTGACMRLGGVGESLFEFCLGDKNGFHILFQSDQNGQYVSRVSGFRNGNTVFLNQLRNSCSEQYCDDDLIEVLHTVAQSLIDRSADSEFPISNVVISNGYAMSSSGEPVVNLGVNNIKQGLSQFYSDISSSGIVLATSNPDNSLVPVELGKKNVPTYLPVREKAVDTSYFDLMQERIVRINALQKVLTGEDWRYIELFEFEKGIEQGFAGEDWYVYVDEQGNIHETIIDIDKRAIEELETARQLLHGAVKKEGSYAR